MKSVKDLDDGDIVRLVASGWRWARVNYPLVSQDSSREKL